LLGLASAVILRSESRGTHDHILLSKIRDSSNLEGQVPVFISPKNRVAQLYPQALGSLFVASYDSTCYGGGIQPRLHHGVRIGWCPYIIGKYSFVNRTIQLWSQLPADALGTLFSKSSNFRKKFRKVINKAKCGAVIKK
jgi:hypothetical protein